MQEVGMTDKQFNSWLKQHVAALKDIQDNEGTEAGSRKLAELIERLESDIDA